MERKLLSNICPSCERPMRKVAMACPICKVKIEGDFSETLFDMLSSEDQKFLEQYLMSGFSIKALEKNSTLGYAAIRSRLDRLIANYKELAEIDSQKKAVLEKLRNDEISVVEAKEILEKLTGE